MSLTHYTVNVTEKCKCISWPVFMHKPLSNLGPSFLKLYAYMNGPMSALVGTQSLQSDRSGYISQ